jgi:hypothetical protein
MHRRIRSHLTFANVVSMIALFVSLGGVGAYAANTIGSSDVIDDSLLSRDIKGKAGTSTTAAENGTLTGVDVSGQAAKPSVGQPFVDGSLTGDDIKNSSLIGADIQNGSLPGTKLAPGVRGARAYARVASSGNVTGSKNITVAKGGNGFYCLDLLGGIDENTATAVVTPNFSNDATSWNPNSTQSIAEVTSINVQCASGTLEVQTGYRQVTTSGGVVTSVDNVRSDQGFFIVVG